MSAFSDPETNNQVTFLLENWGRWCRDDWWRHLNYKVPVTSRYYRPAIKDQVKAVPPVDVDEAWLANEAIISLGLYNHFDDYQLLVSWFAHGRTAIQIARHFDCCRATVYNRLDAAKREFWSARRKILSCTVRQKHA